MATARKKVQTKSQKYILMNDKDFPDCFMPVLVHTPQELLDAVEEFGTGYDVNTVYVVEVNGERKFTTQAKYTEVK